MPDILVMAEVVAQNPDRFFGVGGSIDPCRDGSCDPANEDIGRHKAPGSFPIDGIEVGVDLQQAGCGLTGIARSKSGDPAVAETGQFRRKRVRHTVPGRHKHRQKLLAKGLFRPVQGFGCLGNKRFRWPVRPELGFFLPPRRVVRVRKPVNQDLHVGLGCNPPHQGCFEPG